MGLFDQFPYTNFHDLNLDWLLRLIKELESTVNNFVALNTIKYADPIQWNITTQYEANTVVVDPQTGTAYISSKAVPAGVALTNTDYWSVIFTLNILSANQNLTLRDDGSNVLATFGSAAGDWLLWNSTLYKVSQTINVNEAYVVGYNLTRYTVELFIDDLKTLILNEIGALADLTTTDKTSIVNAINSIVSRINTLNLSLYYNPTLFGAALDGVTDDTAAIEAALAVGNVRFPNGSTVLINELEIPNNRVVDFNDSTISTTTTAIKIGDITDTVGYNYTRDIIVKNAIFALQTNQTAIDIENSILCCFDNIRTDNSYNLPAGAAVFKVVNCFNITFNNIFISGPSNLYNNGSVAFSFDADITQGIAGTNVLTNIHLIDVLIQRVETGIVFNNTNTARYDTFEIDNIGFSHVKVAITMNSSVDTNILRMLTIRNLRVELSESGIVNYGIMAIEGSYFYQDDYPIVNHGNMYVGSSINITGAVLTAIESDGVIDFRNCICGLATSYTYNITGVCYNYDSAATITIAQNGGLPAATQRPEPINIQVNFTGTEIYYNSLVAPLTPKRRIVVKHSGAVTLYVSSSEYYTIKPQDYLELVYDGTWLVNTSGVHTV